jgi:hypothetical protein
MKKLFGSIITVFIFVFGFLSDAFSGSKAYEFYNKKSLDPNIGATQNGLPFEMAEPDWKDSADLEANTEIKFDNLEDKTLGNKEILSEESDDLTKFENLEDRVKIDDLETEATEDWKR